MTNDSTKSSISQPASDTTVYLFDDWFDPIEAGGGPSYRGAGRAAAKPFVTAQNHPYGATALRQPRAAPRVSSSVIVENV